MIIWPMSRLRGVMSCRQAARVLQAYLDGETDVATGRAVAAHLEVCRRCGMEADTYVAIKDALARQARETDPGTLLRLADFVDTLQSLDPETGTTPD